MSKIIHSMVRVLDLDHSLKFYADCFGLTPSHRLDFPSFSLVYLRNAENDAEIELTEMQVQVRSDDGVKDVVEDIQTEC